MLNPFAKVVLVVAVFAVLAAGAFLVEYVWAHERRPGEGYGALGVFLAVVAFALLVLVPVMYMLENGL